MYKTVKVPESYESMNSQTAHFHCTYTLLCSGW